MKLGITALNTQKTNTLIPYNVLVDDVLPLIFSYISAYKYIGKETISTVSKTWKKIIEANKFFGKKSYVGIIEACLKDPRAVLYILGDESIRQHLPHEQFLEISSCNPELAQHILDTKLCGELDRAKIAGLSEDPLANLQLILDAKLHDNFNGYNLTNLDEDLVPVKRSLYTPALCDKITGAGLAKLGEHDLVIAWHILNTQALCDKLDGSNLATLGMYHTEIAKHILYTQELCDKLSSTDLAKLGRYLPDIAKCILDIPKLFKMLSTKHNENNLISLGDNHPAIAKRILDTKALRDNFGEYTLNRLDAKCRFVRDVYEHVAGLKESDMDPETNEHDIYSISRSCAIS